MDQQIIAGKICDEFAKNDERIIVIHKKNGGLSDARNVGLNIAKGKWIYFLDGDDSIKNDAIEYLYNLCDKYNADIIIGKEQLVYDGVSVNSNKNNIMKYNIEVYDSESSLENMLYNTKFSNSSCNKLFKINLFDNIRYPFGKLYEDLGTTYKLISKADKIILSNKKTYNYLTNRSDSIMNKKFDLKRMDGLEFAEEILMFVEKKYPRIKNAAIFRLYLECVFILLKIPNEKQYKLQNEIVYNYIKKYKWNVLKNKKVSKKQKALCLTAVLGKIPLRIVWNIKEKIKINKQRL